jgi:hypothetical protein
MAGLPPVLGIGPGSKQFAESRGSAPTGTRGQIGVTTPTIPSSRSVSTIPDPTRASPRSAHKPSPNPQGNPETFPLGEGQ